MRQLHSDSSQNQWAGVDIKNGTVVQEFWREKGILHINVKELIAATETVKCLAKKFRNCPPVSGQFSGIFIPKKGWGKTSPFKSNHEGFLALVPEKENSNHCRIGTLSPGSSRFLVKKTFGQGGLYHGQPIVPFSEKKLEKSHQTHHRHVCLPWQSPTKNFCFKTTPLGSQQARCLKLSPLGLNRNLCKPPMENYFKLAAKVVGKPPPKMSDGHPPLGWCTMVAPTSKTAVPPHPSICNTSLSRDVQKLPGGIYATTQVAPSLHSVIRKTLEGKQISPEDIDLYLKEQKSIARYDSAFKLLWAICIEKDLPLEDLSIYQLASQIVYLNKFSPSQARNAYSAMLLIPGWDQLRFCPLLHQCKRNWNYSQAKYSTFWDAEDVLQKVALAPLNWKSIEEVRNRLIIVCRLLNLYRSVDLARTWRCQSSVGKQFYVLTQRKNQKKPQWEALIAIPDHPAICPVTLMKHYVQMTAHQVPSGSILLRQLKPPYAPLSNNTVGSITRNILTKFGVPTSFWGPHSTRGAGVQLYKKLGLTSEEVCEVGKWKNVTAFTAHYSRLGASQKASQKISHLVHKVSPIQRAESDWSSIPLTKEKGRRDQEDEAQSIGETRFLLPAVLCIFMAFFPSRPLSLFLPAVGGIAPRI